MVAYYKHLKDGYNRKGVSGFVLEQKVAKEFT